jgi:hypothetical protein
MSAILTEILEIDGWNHWVLSSSRTTSLDLAHLLDRLSCCEAYVHPNGFFAFNVGRFSQSGLLRLHIWDRSHGQWHDDRFSVHDHIYYLYSAVLCGSLREVRYAESSDVGDLNQIYEAHYANGGSVLKKTETIARIAPREENLLRPGDRNFLAPGYFHSIESKSEFSATLVLTEAVKGYEKPRILGPIDGEEEVVSHRERLAESLRSELISSLMASVSTR